MGKKKIDQYGSYLLVVAVVSIVAIVALVLNNTGSLEGATMVKELVQGDPEIGCVDDDSTNEFQISGKLRAGAYTYKDHCDGDNLHQHECDGRNVKHLKVYNCAVKYNGCSAGACV